MDVLEDHGFISFAFDTRTLTSRTWLLLGEAMSKCQHLAGTPLKPAAAAHLASVYLARGVLATTAIEGNTLSVEDAEKIVRDGRAGMPESREYLEREVVNVLGAVREIDEALRQGKQLPITPERLMHLNSLVLDGIPDKPEVRPGKYREHSVGVGTYRAPVWHEVPSLVKQLTDWLHQLRSQITGNSSDEDKFVNAVLAATLAHLYIAWIHPFGNGNGRTARLIEVQILSESGVVPLVATNLLSDHYNKTRTAYYLALDAARGGIGAFIQYAILGFVDELRDQIAVVQEQSKSIHWESYVYETFRSKPSTDARDRQRLLALALPEGRTVTTDETVTLTTELARRYASTGERTPARDLNDLVKMGLVEKVSKREYRVSREIIMAFRPPVAHPQPNS
jgi:Fic family protein